MDLHERVQTLEHDIPKMRERLSALEQDEKSVHRRLENLEKLTKSVHIIATETKAMRGDVNGLANRVDEIEKVPKKRYETAVTAIITTIIGIVVGYFLKGGF